MQPLLTQVPPNRLRSIITTFIPVPASRTARGAPAWPVPITIASYLVAIGIPPLGLQSSTIFTVPTGRGELLTRFHSLRRDRRPLRSQNIFLNLACRSFG